MYPGPAYLIDTVAPGDNISSEVQYVGTLSGSSEFYLSLTDLNPDTGYQASGDLLAAGTVTRAWRNGSSKAPLVDLGHDRGYSALGRLRVRDVYRGVCGDGQRSKRLDQAFPSNQIYPITLLPLSGLGPPRAV